ncbi:MAG: DUF1501 domain-containing protein [bacterium]|nr:DUF1501 domain-containing protein [bacterium]
MQHLSTCSCSRRKFLKGSGVTLAGFGLTSLFPTPLIASTLSDADALQIGNNRKMLFIFMRGGNDGLNTVIPHGDTAGYNDTNRPNLYIPPGAAIDLNGFASLHPALADMTDAYNAGELAVVHRVGYANNSRSHFDGQRIWENGDPTQTQLFEGWLYRYIVENAVNVGVDLPVLTAQASPPVLVRGAETFVNVTDPDSFAYNAIEPKRSKIADALRDVYSNLVGLEQYRPVLSQTGVKLADTLDEYDSWDQANWDPKDPDTPANSLFPVSPETNQVGFAAQSYEFFASLKVAVLSLLESSGNNNGTRVAGTQIVGWDTHSGQGATNGTQAQLLTWLGYAFRSVRIVLKGQAIDPRNYAPIWDDTLVTTLSEFGRTSLQNGNGGTDHAAASCLFMQGGTVNGGVYNCDNSTWPAGVMFGVDGRYLLERTDYRSIFWEILRDHMGAAAGGVDNIFPSYTSLGLGSQELGVIT